METFVITGITKGASALAAKMQRNGYQARVYRKTNVIAIGDLRPWAILNGYITHQSQVVPVGKFPTQNQIDNAISVYGI